MKPEFTVEIIGKPSADNLERFAESIRKFYADPENIKYFEKWKKEHASKCGG